MQSKANLRKVMACADEYIALTGVLKTVKRAVFFLLVVMLNDYAVLAQKPNLEAATKLVYAGKYRDAYNMMNEKKFKQNEKETDNYNFMYSFTCKELFKAEPDPNSEYRNLAIKHAKILTGSKDTTWQRKGHALIRFLTTSIYNNLIVDMNAHSKDSSGILNGFTNQTLASFLSFPIPDNWADSTLYYFGSTFYNDGVIAIRSVNFESPLDSIAAMQSRVDVLFKNAVNYFKILCVKYEKYCNMEAIIMKGVSKD